MRSKTLPLIRMSVGDVYNGDKATYEVPIYQRNYAWEKEEIAALIQDVFDAKRLDKKTYFIGTLVSFHKGEQVYEVIDGQQRLTTIRLILFALGISCQNQLTYKARKKSNDTIQNIPQLRIDEKDTGIENGFQYAKEAIDEIVPKAEQPGFKIYFQNHVSLIHYQVPKDIDLNQYFEIMNSRGEQLEKHEIIKARLIEELEIEDREKFARLWDFCSEMNVYIQQKYSNSEIFGQKHDEFEVTCFDALPSVDDRTGKSKIADLINGRVADKSLESNSRIDTFQPITDFSNFLLIVLKLTRTTEEEAFEPTNFNLDDKELINEFEKIKLNQEFVKRFGFNLLRAKFLLDNHVVHHSNEEDTTNNNPWKLQYWQKEDKDGYLKNRDGDSDVQHKLVQLLSMFEVTFSARQRKNYLFYCLLYLSRSGHRDLNKYYKFVSGLADKYFRDVYLNEDNLNEVNTPKPGSFDNTILTHNVMDIRSTNNNVDFVGLFGDGGESSRGIPLFIFNYLDYKLWEKYADELRGEGTIQNSKERTKFFASLGCSDFELSVFRQFYFSRTRKSLEHFFPQANADGKNDVPNQAQINCLGNYAMIGSEANSSGSNWSPKSKLSHYLDASEKIKFVSVASIKFMIMMRKCSDNSKFRELGKEWIYDDIKEHQGKMLEILLGDRN